MVSSRCVSVQEQYAASSQDIRFESLVSGESLLDDDALAELIEADGRARLELGREVDLSRYLRVIPDLASRQVPLDAAIDVALRWMSASSRPRPDAVEAMVDRFPHLSSSIREAAALANAMWSTSGLRSKLERPRREVPSDFGPRTAGGRPRFELRRVLGTGGWGEVYLAQDRQLSDESHEALVAIKFLTGLRSGTWERQRLIDEAAKARRVDHPNVARVLDRGVTEGDEDYIVYEYVSGGDLAEWLDRQKVWPELRRSVALVAKVARGVQAAHAAGLVHCDLKPGNILLGSDGEPRVSDFGIAVRAGEGPSAGGSDGRPAGNLAFIAPEQYRGEEGAFTVAADIYALGGLLYYLVTRTLPNGSSVEEIRRTHTLDGGRVEPPSLVERLPWLDKDLDTVCRRALAVKPGERYPSAAAFADDLEAWLRHEPVHWARAGLTRRVMLWGRRSPILAAMLALVLLTGSVGGIVSAHWSRVAREQTQQATQAKGAVAGVRNTLKTALLSFQRMSAENGAVDVLPFGFIWEWTEGPAILGENTTGFQERWSNRIQITRQYVASRRQSGEPDDVVTMLSEGCLVMFHLQLDEFESAEQLLAALIPKWRAAVPNAEDGFAKLMERLRVIASAQKVVREAAQGPLAPDRLAAGRTVLDELRKDLRLPQTSDELSGVQRMAIRMVHRLSHKSVLDVPDVHSQTKRRIDQFPRPLTPDLVRPQLKKAASK